MIQITQKAVISNSDDFADLRREYELRKSVRLPNFIEEQLLTQLTDRLKSTTFAPKIEGNPGDEFGKVLFVPNTEPALFLFQMMMNQPQLFNAIRQVTNCEEIGNFFGRIHRSLPSSNHQISWHGDNADYRMVGLSVNLSDDSFSGGTFQIRFRDTENILNEIPGSHQGDAFLFAIDPALQHRLLPLSDGGNRTVGVGWFRSQPDRATFAKSFFIERFISAEQSIS